VATFGKIFATSIYKHKKIDRDVVIFTSAYWKILRGNNSGAQ